MGSRSATETIPRESNVPEKIRPLITSKTPSSLRIRNVKIDPSRALEPTQKKLSTIESQRIISVFDDSIKRIKIVTALPFILKHMDRFRVSLGVELAEMIRQHFRIQSSYQEIRNQLDILLQNRASQAEYLEAKNAVVQSATAESRKDEEIKKTYNFFDDDNDFDFEEGEKSGGDSEDDAEGEGYKEEAGESEEGEIKERKQSVKEKRKEEDDKEQIVIPEGVKVPEVAAEVNRTKETASAATARSSQENVAENISQMVLEPIEADSHMSIIDYEPRIQETLRNLGLVAQQVSHSCKNILRLFTLNPTAMNLVNSDDDSMRNEGGQSIINNMYELRDIIMQKLLSTPEEEMERQAYLEEISHKENYNRVVIEKLEKELKEAIEDRDNGIRKNNEIIRHLQTDLHQIEKFSEENIRRTKAEVEKQEISDYKNSEQRIQRLQSEINSLQTQVSNLISEHREIEADLRAKKYKVENEVENWIQKYDQDLGERQDEYEEIDLIYTEEKKQLLELEERFAILEKEYMEIMEERRAAREKNDRAQRELARVIRAATTIQAFWRSYKVRKAINKKKKVKKGGKKGKGKGKKK